jgi:hypothetical protein
MSLRIFLVVAVFVSCRCQPSLVQGDKPGQTFPVLAVFLGCQAPSAGVELPDCPPNSSRACQGLFHWCRDPAGNRHGSWIRLFPTGKLSLRIEYEDGQRHGPWTQWYPDGRKWKEGAYNRGKEHGSWSGWYPNGQKSYVHYYDNDAPVGRWTHWDEKGYKVEEATFR